ncbi:hypothetical protein Scep_004596 [Stephania cephalantha]|uniref:Uncharacterized protein n=1 Tax=Stephania cephalantha TaxID=152367 RepID=A0AAP0KSS6_9MAGN
MADHYGNPPLEGQEEDLDTPPQQFVTPVMPHAPVAQQRPVVPQYQPLDQRVVDLASQRLQANPWAQP